VTAHPENPQQVLGLLCGALLYVVDKAYLKEPDFARYARARGDALEERGSPIAN
jgi:hypothetical protein